MIKTMAELAFAGRSREPNVSEYYQRQEKIEAVVFCCFFVVVTFCPIHRDNKKAGRNYQEERIREE